MKKSVKFKQCNEQHVNYFTSLSITSLCMVQRGSAALVMTANLLMREKRTNKNKDKHQTQKRTNNNKNKDQTQKE